MTEPKKYREWWVIDDQGDSFIFSLKEDAFSYKTDVDAHFKINQEIIHVVEAQAVKELEAEVEDFKNINARIVEDHKRVVEELESTQLKFNKSQEGCQKLLTNAYEKIKIYLAERDALKSENKRLREALMVIGSSDFIEGEYYGSFTRYRKMLVDQIVDLALKKGDE